MDVSQEDKNINYREMNTHNEVLNPPSEMRLFSLYRLELEYMNDLFLYFQKILWC